MAWIVCRPNNLKWVQFRGVGGKRHTLRLGKCSKDQATAVKLHVSALLTAQRLRVGVDPITARWLSSLPVVMLKRLAAVGLHDYTPAITLADLKAEFFAAKRFADSTRRNIGFALDNLTACFGGDISVDQMTKAKGDEFRDWLLRHISERGKPMAPATVSRRVRHAQQLMQFAVDSKYLEENPFKGVKTGRESNRDRDHFVSLETMETILHAVDAEFAVILSLLRFGGLRVSEARRFRWDWLDWEAEMLTVDSTKTGQRSMPIFGHLRHWLKAADQTRPMAISRITPQAWAKRLKRLLKNLDIKPWPKLFQNMRASRATELRDAGYPGAVAAMWLGHSEKIADDHYVQIAKHHIDRAILEGSKSEGAILPKHAD